MTVIRHRPDPLKFARFVLSMWNQVEVEQATHPRGEWHKLEAKQAYRDALQAAVLAHIIEDYRFPWDVRYRGEWICLEPKKGD